GWNVQAPGARGASSRHITQTAAVSAARETLRNVGGGELVIHGEAWRIRSDDTAPAGDDPHPPLG
ncbi:MAG: hypothetical protein QOI61_850, partial [Actinomycetota bacterium]